MLVGRSPVKVATQNRTELEARTYPVIGGTEVILERSAANQPTAITLVLTWLSSHLIPDLRSE